MGLVALLARMRDPSLSEGFEGLLPRDNPAYTRFAVNFFTSIGLGGLTDDLREFLRSQVIMKSDCIYHFPIDLYPNGRPVKFFMGIGLGGLTDDLREFLRSQVIFFFRL